MIEIKNLHGNVIHTVDADTLFGADLRGVDLQQANLTEAARASYIARAGFVVVPSAENPAIPERTAA